MKKTLPTNLVGCTAIKPSMYEIGDYIVVAEAPDKEGKLWWTAAVILAGEVAPNKLSARELVIGEFGTRWSSFPTGDELSACTEQGIVHFLHDGKDRWLRNLEVTVVRLNENRSKPYVLPLLRDCSVSLKGDLGDRIVEMGDERMPIYITYPVIARGEIPDEDFAVFPIYRGMGFLSAMKRVSFNTILKYPIGHYSRDTVTERTLELSEYYRKKFAKRIDKLATQKMKGPMGFPRMQSKQ